ncbi:MAG: DUF3800 domain-containing protein [Bacteroidota bacterium]
MTTQSGDAAARRAKWDLDRLESCIAALCMARSLHASSGLDTTELDRLIDASTSHRDSLIQGLNQGRLEPRHNRARLPAGAPIQRSRYVIFLDECGGHSRPVEGELQAFCLCAIAVEERVYEEIFVPRWEGLKARFLLYRDSVSGLVRGKSAVTHEPGLRPDKLRYRLRHIPNGVALFEKELSEFIEQVPFDVVAAVVLKREHFQQYGNNPIDAFLPSSIYSVCLDFIMERSVHFLSHKGNGAYGRIVAESREKREDAILQYEFVRLQLEGTQYISGSWFRQQLSPTIEFRVKADNVAGLQLVDVLARPIAEKALSPGMPSVRWQAIKIKFYDGCQDRPESYGLKVFPVPVDRDFFR